MTTEPKLQILDDYLESNDAHPDAMGLSDLDGFLTGIACSPEPIPQKEWLDHALGDAGETPKPIKRIIRERLEETRKRLENGQPLEPWFWETKEGTVIAMDWCEGFMDAVKMRPQRWDAFVQTDIGSKLMLPILVHMIDDHGESAMGIPRAELDATLDAAADALPTTAPAIFRQIRILTQN